LAEPRPRSSRPAAPADGSPLKAFLDALERPLAFVRQAPAPVAARASFPAAEFARRALALREQVRDTLTRKRLEDLAASLQRWEATPVGERPGLVAECWDALSSLREGRGAPVKYRRHADSVDDDLQSLSQSLQFVPGVGPRRGDILRKFGLSTIEDLLYHLPFRYEDRRVLTPIRDLRVGETASVVGELTHLAERHVGRLRRRILEGVLRDETGFLALTWFNQVAYFRSRYEPGQRCVVHGKIEGAPGGQKRIVHPEVLPASDIEGQGVVPVYGKPTTMNPAAMRKIAASALSGWASRLPSVLPEAVISGRELMDIGQAMRLLHHPGADADVDALNGCRSLAHRSLVFDELFFLQLGMALRRRRVESETGFAMGGSDELGERLRTALPFRLTMAQQRVVHEIVSDMAKPRPMHRLVQGDVGSGKTVVALFAALRAIANGFQAALMAPTELLAEQHAANLQALVAPLGIEVALLVGLRGKGKRSEMLQRIAGGEVPLVVGTHAVIQEKVTFARLGLGIVDEQHRFGVLQRAALRALGARDAVQGERMPHMLLMTATPIPRTLATSVYGDLDISVLDQLPPGRKPIRTLLVSEPRRTAAYDMVRKALDAGQQAYVVYPLVEESAEVPLRDATTMAEELARAVFHGYRVGLVHGRMKPAEKDAVMRQFKDGGLQVLVSTTVIEVGIDVPNATVMVIEHADRFGLAQLHQLRGRVGRGQEQSTCVLIAPFQRGDEAHRRLTAMVETNDGFRIADIDLEIRGPGDLLGTRQSGLPDFRVANLIRDRGLLEDARRAADVWLAGDPTLSTPQSVAVRRILAHRWAGRLGLADIG
jgi:ATP-dependent DNA helicase RecG